MSSSKPKKERQPTQGQGCVMLSLAGGAKSRNELAGKTGNTYSTIYAQVTSLTSKGYVKVVREEPRHGAPEKFFGLTGKGREWVAENAPPKPEPEPAKSNPRARGPRSSRLPTRRQGAVLRSLAAGAKTRNQIAADRGVTYSAVCPQVTSLNGKGYVRVVREKKGRGAHEQVFGLTDKGRTWVAESAAVETSNPEPKPEEYRAGEVTSVQWSQFVGDVMTEAKNILHASTCETTITPRLPASVLESLADTGVIRYDGKAARLTTFGREALAYLNGLEDK